MRNECCKVSVKLFLQDFTKKVMLQKGLVYDAVIHQTLLLISSLMQLEAAPQWKIGNVYFPGDCLLL